MLPKSKALKNQREFRNSRCGRHRHKDIRLTEGGLELYVIQIEKSAEVIVATGNEPIYIIGRLTR